MSHHQVHNMTPLRATSPFALFKLGTTTNGGLKLCEEGPHEWMNEKM